MNASRTRTRGEGISKTFGTAVALHPMTIDVGPGEWHALIGDAAAGKSTLASILGGTIAPDSGRVVSGGAVELVSQSMPEPPATTVAEYLAPALCRGRLRVARWRALRDRAELILDRWHVPASPDTPAAELAPDQRHVLRLARALHAEADLVVLDEPATGLSAAAIGRLLDRLQSLCERGVAILYVTRDLDPVSAHCSHVTTLREGRTVAAAATPAPAAAP